MESPAPELDQQLDIDQQGNGNDSDFGANAKSSQYQEISTTQSIPTKSGNEDPLSGGFVESERPISAGTSHSSQFDLENSEDVALLAALTTHSKTRSEEALEANEPTAIGGPLLARPESSDGINADAIFSFAKANRQQMDFTGTRKCPVSHVTSITAQAEENAHDNFDQEYARMEGENSPQV